MSFFEELSDKIFTEEAGSTCYETIHWISRDSPACVNLIFQEKGDGRMSSPFAPHWVTITPRREKVNSEVIIRDLESLSEKEKMCYVIGLIADFPLRVKEWLLLK